MNFFLASWEQVEAHIDRALDLRFARMLHGHSESQRQEEPEENLSEDDT